MRQQHRIAAVVLMGASFFALLGADGPAEPPAGQTIFVAQGCQACHAVPAAGLAKAGDDTISAPDIAGLGDRFCERSLRRWMKRERDDRGYTHLQYFEGSDGELELLVSWLLEQ
jgi:cytochrome c553